ncbi:CD209 antigen-like protein E [Mesocricetus auratus]|uniref:CD209 antigen-like protein E n=1 Tax=Mesocricetus auratus TaxID=10036 RepID=A0A3Q0DBF2_MESAU|nr:CD209 antigen-like protein E [Mesocricetus auratus]XP_021091755.1 CD209 antigen-like protein E [Mesocricetus auratus]
MSCSQDNQHIYNEITEVKAEIGCSRHGLVPLVLQLLFLILFSAVFVAFLLQAPKVPCTQDQAEIYQELMQLKLRVDLLCRPCSWDWIFFRGNCYFFSITKRNWTDSLIACQEVGAQLIIIESYEEQDFLLKMYKIKGRLWIGLSDMKHEGSWQWVNGSSLSPSFKKYWTLWKNEGHSEKDCAELTDHGWSEDNCKTKKFWVCKKSSVSCPNN